MILTHRGLVYAAYGWLLFSGVSHILIDVAAPVWRGKAAPEHFYAMHSAYAMSKMLVGALALVAAFSGSEVFRQWPGILFGIVAGVAWLVFAFAAISYVPPKFSAALFLALAIACGWTAQAPR
jgi:uncharacterized membrane protein HdeD (DUF308 family)